MIPVDLTSLRTLLTPLSPEQHRALAAACARHALELLPAEACRDQLTAALAEPGSGRAAILAHPWGLHRSGHARYLVWLSACWASWPLLSLSTWIAEQAAFYAQAAVAELADRPTLYQVQVAAEALWQRALLAPPAF